MKKTFIILLPVVLIIGTSAFNLKRSSQINKSRADSVADDRKRFVEELRNAIKGKENEPAENVFKNIKLLKGVPAGRFLSIMDNGYGNSLGVTCNYCHKNGEWDLDIKPEKEITRKMAEMNNTINNQLLKNIDGLKSANPIVNCTTCHRGSVKPAIQL